MGLYEDENVHIYNPEHGESEVFFSDQDQQKIQEDAQALRALKASEGWALVKEFLDGRIERYRQALVSQVDLDAIRRLQEAIKSYQSIESYINAKIAEADRDKLAEASPQTKE